MIPPHSITVRPPLAVVGHPTRAWKRTIKITQNQESVMTLRPTLEVKASNGQLLPVHLPWIHMPAAIRAKDSAWVPVVISSGGHALRGPEKLYIAFDPATKGAAGVTVSAAPAARLIIGKYAGVNRSALQVHAPWIVWRRHAVVDAHLSNTGHTWFVPMVSVSANGQTRTTALPPLLPGMHEQSASAITLPTWGITLVQVDATGSAPVSHRIVSLPGLPIGIALGAAGLVEGLNLIARKSKNTTKKETDQS